MESKDQKKAAPGRGLTWDEMQLIERLGRKQNEPLLLKAELERLSKESIDWASAVVTRWPLLLTAVRENMYPLIEFLVVDQKVNINVGRTGTGEESTALHLACSYADPKVVELLCKHGANVYALNYYDEPVVAVIDVGMGRAYNYRDPPELKDREAEMLEKLNILVKYGPGIPNINQRMKNGSCWKNGFTALHQHLQSRLMLPRFYARLVELGADTRPIYEPESDEGVDHHLNTFYDNPRERAELHDALLMAVLKQPTA